MSVQNDMETLFFSIRPNGVTRIGIFLRRAFKFVDKTYTQVLHNRYQTVIKKNQNKLLIPVQGHFVYKNQQWEILWRENPHLSPTMTTIVPYANSLYLDEMLSNSASHPDPSCSTLRHFQQLLSNMKHFGNWSRREIWQTVRQFIWGAKGKSKMLISTVLQ